MKIIVTGILAFVIWSGASSYWYIYKIKDLGGTAPVQATSETAENKPESVPVEPTKVFIENPGIFTLKNGFDHAEFISDTSLPAFLGQVTKFIDQNAGTQIIITGYTDHIGSKAYNQALALRRAAVVRDFLVEQGISETLIQLHAKGEADPIADNTTEQGRARNRRTTVEIN